MDPNIKRTVQDPRPRLIEDIEHLEETIARTGIWDVARISFITAIMIYIFHFVFDHYTEDKSLVQYVEGYHPLKLLADWCFWFIVHYFIYRGNQKSLAKKKRELGAAREKYGLGEEPAP